MSGKSTHFEIFQRKSRKSNWVLMDAHPDRQVAVNKARTFWVKSPNSGVKVIKEARDEQKGNYDSVVVTSFGDCDDDISHKSRRDSVDERVPPTLCQSPDDLLKPEARKSYQEALPEFLERHKVLPGELVFRPDLLDMLESSGTEITQAIQRIAIRRVGGEGLHAAVREMFELTSQAFESGFQARREGIYQKWDKPIEEVVKAARKSKSPIKSFSSALADRLKKSPNWRDKLATLVVVWEEIETLDERDRGFCNKIINHYFTEWIEAPNTLVHMIGETSNGVEVLDRLIAILEPNPSGFLKPNPIADQPSAQILARAIHLGVLPTARHRIISLIFDSLASGRRLYPDDLQIELEFLKKSGDRLVKLLGLERQNEMYESFCVRSKTLMVNDTIEEYVGTLDHVEQPLKLLSFRNYLVGQDARAKLISFVRGVISQPQFENACLGKRSPVTILSTLRATQMELIKSDFPEKERLHGAQDIDKLGVRLIGQHHLFRNMIKKAKTPEKAALALFRLASEALPHGQCAGMAASTAIKLLQTEPAKKNLAGNLDLKAAIAQVSKTAQIASEIKLSA